MLKEATFQMGPKPSLASGLPLASIQRKWACGLVKSLRLGVEDRQHSAAESSPDEQAVTFDGDNSVFLVED